MERKWRFLNRHCNSADGEVVRLQVSPLSQIHCAPVRKSKSQNTVALELITQRTDNQTMEPCVVK